MKHSCALAAVIALLVGVVLAGCAKKQAAQVPAMAPAVRLAAGLCHEHDGLPDSNCTPGATNADIRQDNIQQNICNPNWSTKSIRPPVSYTNKLKLQQIAEYGYTDTNPKDYEEDHLISLELGGNPTDPKNLWPEPYNTPNGAKVKDTVENYLHRQVCSGAMSLQEAQHGIATDWKQYLTAMK